MYYLLCGFLVTLCSFQNSNAGYTPKFPDLPIVYPGPTKATKYIPYISIFEYQPYEIPDECKHQDFCTVKPYNYPEERFNDLFAGKGFMPQPKPDMNDGIDNKQGDPDEKDGCESTVTYEPIYNVKTSRGDWRTVIQSPRHNFVQKVRLETCKETGAHCFNVFPASPRFVTLCKQKYSTWELLVDGDDGNTETIQVDLPICCSCVYRTSSSGSRWG